MAITLTRLIQQRMRDLAITRGELVRRMGYSNIAKGCRRIEQICSGHVEMAENLRAALSRGLGVNLVVVDKAIDGTRSAVIAAEDRAYPESFKPHAVLLTKERIPSQIILYAMTGGARHRIIRFKEGSPPETYATQAREALPRAVPFFGPPIGYVVNYNPDFALRFSKEGRLVERLDRAYRVPGQASVNVGGKEIGEKAWAGLLGDVNLIPSSDSG